LFRYRFSVLFFGFGLRPAGPAWGFSAKTPDSACPDLAYELVKELFVSIENLRNKKRGGKLGRKNF